MEAVTFTSPDYIKIKPFGSDTWISSETLGIYVDLPSVPPFSQQRVSVANVGLDCDISVRDDVWEDISISIPALSFYSKDDFDFSPVYAFIANAELLEISRFPDYYFKVRSVNAVAPSAQYGGDKIRFTFRFTCKPFKYLKDNDYIEFNGETITNPGTRFCRPIYHITGTTGTVLTVNGSAFTIADTDGTNFYIDCERLLAYFADGTNILPKTSGQFPFLQPGINNVDLSDGEMTVKLNARCY